MNNPFKFGSIVDGDFFTDRREELLQIERMLNSDNHIILISPRRFGKSSLVQCAISKVSRPSIVLNLQSVVSETDFASRLLKQLFKLYPWEKVKHYMSHFRIVPTITTTPMTDQMEVSFMPSVSDASVVVEDVMQLLDTVSKPEKKLIVVLDEFQEVISIRKGFDRQLRSIMQTQKNINYVILGSQESMMEEIFEKKKSPFYHFGQLMRLNKIPKDDFYKYIIERLPKTDDSGRIAEEILQFTLCHPYYTQQLASQVWNLMYYENTIDNVVTKSIEVLVRMHDLDFERLWMNFNKTDRRIMQELCLHPNQSLMTNRGLASSTIFSSIKRLMKQGYVIKTTSYEVEDPFFRLWIVKTQG